MNIYAPVVKWKVHYTTVSPTDTNHRQELRGNSPVFIMVIVIYRYIEIIWIIFVISIFSYNIDNNENIVEVNQLM